MAIEPPPPAPPAPPTPAVPQQVTPPPTAKKSGCFGRGCGFGCGGCLLVFVLALLLAAGGGWWFFVVQASAAVRGTQFERLVRANNSNLIKVFAGTVGVSGGGKTVNVNTGQEIDAAANGTLSAVRPIQRDPQDPYALTAQCTSAVAAGTAQGTLQVSTGEPISTGQTAEVDYDSSGGTLSVAFCYPGSFMTLSVFTPDGVEHSDRNGASGLHGHFTQAGHYKTIVHAENVPTAEAFVVAFATNAACSAEKIDTGGVVRETLSNSEIAKSLADSGVSGVTLFVQGASATSARLVYYSNLG